jgi:hypothetical protein
VKITRKRPNTWRPKGAAKVAATERKKEAAKLQIKAAYTSLPDDAWPRTPPALILNSQTQKWERWEEIHPADRTPKPLIPAITGLARALNTDVSGKARATGLTPAKQARQEKHDSIVAAFRVGNLGHLLEPPFDVKRMMAIQHELKKLPAKERPSVEAFVRRLRGNR